MEHSTEGWEARLQASDIRELPFDFDEGGNIVFRGEKNVFNFHPPKSLLLIYPRKRFVLCFYIDLYHEKSLFLLHPKKIVRHVKIMEKNWHQG